MKVKMLRFEEACGNRGSEYDEGRCYQLNVIVDCEQSWAKYIKIPFSIQNTKLT